MSNEIECLKCGWKGEESDLTEADVTVEQEDWAGTMRECVCPHCGSVAWEPCD